MNTNLKAIETEYAGYRFRSRIEARWAVFMDTLGIRWEYEKEGFDLDGTWYLPDFWLPKQQCWLEIKGQEHTEKEEKKAELLYSKSKNPVFILSGGIAGYDCFAYCEVNHVITWWEECMNCHQIGLSRARPMMRWKDLPWLFCQCHKQLQEPDWPIIMWTAHVTDTTGKFFNRFSDRLITAYKTAQSARFEHGETPTR